jgi:hypothetical protein
MIIIISVLISLSIICVILRIFARVKRRIGFGLDDYLCFVATIFLISMLIELVLCTFFLLMKRNAKIVVTNGLLEYQGVLLEEMVNMQ